MAQKKKRRPESCQGESKCNLKTFDDILTVYVYPVIRFGHLVA